MKTLKAVAIATSLLLGLLWLSPAEAAQAPREAAAPKAGEGPPPFGPFPFAPPPFPLKDALDTDRDGKLSRAEIERAAESLKRLDKNQDGKLSAEEIGWPPRFPGFPPDGGPPGGGRGFPFGGPSFGGREQAGRSLAERLMSRDANRDGKVAKEELPKSMQWLIPMADKDQDGAIDEKESRALAEQLGMAASRPDSK